MIEYLPLVLTGLGLTASILYYTLVLRNQNKTREAQLFMSLYETYRSLEFRNQQVQIGTQQWTDFEDFWAKYGPFANPDAWSNWQSVAGFFNGLGVLLKKGLIDVDMLEELFSSVTFASWIVMEPIVIGFRKWSVSGNEEKASKKYLQYSGFEYLYNELKKREQPNR
jgi:hypothetical protein